MSTPKSRATRLALGETNWRPSELARATGAFAVAVDVTGAATGVADGAAGLATAGGCSPSANRNPMVAPHGNVSPTSAVRCRIPPAGDSTSLSTLSVSMRSTGMPGVMAAPSSTSHSRMVPSSMVRPSLGMMNSVAMWGSVCFRV